MTRWEAATEKDHRSSGFHQVVRLTLCPSNQTIPHRLSNKPVGGEAWYLTSR